MRMTLLGDFHTFAKRLFLTETLQIRYYYNQFLVEELQKESINHMLNVTQLKCCQGRVWMQVYLSSKPKSWISIFVNRYFTNELSMRPLSPNITRAGLEPCLGTMESREMKYAVQISYVWALLLDQTLSWAKICKAFFYYSIYLCNIYTVTITHSHRWYNSKQNTIILKQHGHYNHLREL